MEFEVSPCHNLVLIDRKNGKVKYVWNDMYASFFVKVQEKEDQNKKTNTDTRRNTKFSPLGPTFIIVIENILTNWLNFVFHKKWQVRFLIFILTSWRFRNILTCKCMQKIRKYFQFFSKVRLQNQQCDVESESKCYFSWWRVKGNERLLAGGG